MPHDAHDQELKVGDRVITWILRKLFGKWRWVHNPYVVVRGSEKYK